MASVDSPSSSHGHQEQIPISNCVPRGFRTYVANAGVKDGTDDFVCVASDTPCAAVGVFTQSRFAGPCVELSKRHIENGTAQAVVVVSKNANVATGRAGEHDALQLAGETARALRIAPSDIVLGGTGLIGHRWPLERLLPHAARIAESRDADFLAAARGIMTTDTTPKMACARVGEACLVGIAKGVGMMEPNMATLLVFLFTDAAVDRSGLRGTFLPAVERTFNSMSIDTDTSTSDTAVLMANGIAGPVDTTAFTAAVDEVCEKLMFAILRDGEGATRTIAVTVSEARDTAQAKAVAKLVVNSPLVKAAIHGADPNWGRIAMAIGKAEDHADITPERTRITLTGREVFPELPTEAALAEVASALSSADDVQIEIALGIGAADATVWGCDLSPEYVRLNSEYST